MREADGIHTVTAQLGYVGHHVGRLLGELDGGLLNATVVQPVWVHGFDLGQDRRVVRLLGVQLVVAQHIEAFGLRLPLERVGNAFTVGARVVQDVDRPEAQRLNGVIGHIRSLEGICGDGAEVNRLAVGSVLADEVRVSDIGVGRTGRDQHQARVRRDRRHGFARTAHLRTDNRHDVGVGHELLGVGRGLRRIVLACGDGAIILEQWLNHDLAGDTRDVSCDRLDIGVGD